MHLYSQDLDSYRCYQLLNSMVTPRPIAWVSSVSAEGIVNLAPHSYFNIVSTYPPMIGFCSVGEKDTARNIKATKEFVVNVVTEEVTERMNLTAVNFPSDLSELDEIGLTRADSHKVAVPRVAESPLHLECKLVDIHLYGEAPAHFIVGEVVAFHLDEKVLKEDKVDPHLLKAVGRMGGYYYNKTTDTFEVPRVSYEQYQEMKK
ncbi:flavin reductase family protein [Caldalkalibacillus mannanilyticus]|uniref:flavin reductase family protein n=1 Tax=Caldalkalibacillus mannanilyticus TaxID=1418 RepID=UPI000469423A|nr:flavin reductase family protein [Caldalkalibacillus mannanilyticus]